MITTHRTPASRTAPRALAAIAAAAVAGLALSGCVVWPPAAGGPRVETEHAVSDDVHALRLDTAGDVEVRLGDEPGLRVSAPASVSDRLTVSERDGVLVLGLKGPGWTSGRVTYVLTVRSLDEVLLKGAGDVTADFSAADRVTIAVDGAGDVHASGIDASEVEVTINGAGDVRVTGAAERGSLRINGAGTIFADALELQRAHAEIRGAADIHVFAVDTLDAEIHGMGDIHVTGSPRITSELRGLGEIVHD